LNDPLAEEDRMMRRCIRPYLALSLTIAAVAAARPAAAGFSYPVNDCVNTKQTQAATYCKSVLKAWAAFDKSGDAAGRDASIQSAAAKLATQWTNAEAKASTKGTNCADTTLSETQAQTLIDTATTAIAGDANGGLTLATKSDATCGNKILTAAATACQKLLQADAGFIKKLANAAGRDKMKATARSSFAAAFQLAKIGGCPSTSTSDGLQSRLDGIDADIVANTTISPNVDATQFMTISPTGTTTYQKKQLSPQCVHGQPYQFFAKRGSVNKLLMYYEGGGACWDPITCGSPTCTDHIDANPNAGVPGFADLTNPNNPFRDWSIVFISYCSCDIHFGGSDKQYTPTLLIHHHGYDNARVAEKWAREHFLSPDVVFVTGSSAGAYGAWFNGPLHESVWPASQLHVLADAGNGVATTDFLKNFFPNWNFNANLPKNIKGVKEAFAAGSIQLYTEAVAKAFPSTTWAHYATAYDGSSGGQSAFYNIMLHNNDLIGAVNWWTGCCAFNQVMVQQVHDTAAALTTSNNYRYYIGTGARHTMWGSNKVYDDTTGGVPTLVDWINATLASSPPFGDDPAWTNVECANCGLLLSGDPRPSPLQSPFVREGSDVVVECAP
jgi:pectinacetylesterase